MNTLSFLNLSQEYNVRKKANMPMIVFCLLAFIAGVCLVVYASSGSEENVGMTSLFVGASIALASLALMFVKFWKWVYIPTGSTLIQDSLEIDAQHLKDLHPRLLQLSPSMEDINYDLENSRILLNYIYAADGEFAAFQISRFSSLMYLPMIEPAPLAGNKARDFVKLLKSEMQTLAEA